MAEKLTVTRLPVLLLFVTAMTSGCALGAVAALDAVIGGVGIYQRWQDRGVQKEQNAEIKALREEIGRLRERLR